MSSTALIEASLVGGGAAIGAITRYGIHEIYGRWHVSKFSHPPLWGIVAVNIVASGILGVLSAGENVSRMKLLLFGTGFCGGMSTFSTFAVESVKLASTPRLLAAYVIASNIGCIGAAAAGYNARNWARRLKIR